jgi:hypothetical protein
MSTGADQGARYRVVFNCAGVEVKTRPLSRRKAELVAEELEEYGFEVWVERY